MNKELVATATNYKAVIGLEVHAQLLTRTKIFNSDSTEYGNMPNTNLSVITLGHPGTLPKLNLSAVESAIKLGLACKSKITEYNIFARKNYFYPDLPKGYQISQDKTPICEGGTIKIKLKDGQSKEIELTRIHLEEDAGKSIHLDEETDTLVDYNRAGVPLVEIVTEPVICSGEEAYQYLTEIRKLVRYLDICDGNMEEGSLRCDANISVMKKDAKEFGTRVEVKNMNSIRNVQRAIEFEISRHIELLENGGKINRETRQFNAVEGTTHALRTKEEMNDYRYFPEPDVQPLVIKKEWLEQVKKEMPPLPDYLYDKFTKDYSLPDYDAGVLTDQKALALYFDELCKHTNSYKAASNWVMVHVKGYLNERALGINQFPISPIGIADLIALIESGKISNSIAVQKLYPAMLEQPDKKASALAEDLELFISDNHDELEKIINKVLEENPTEFERLKAGENKLIGMFMGQIMKASKGKADPKQANKLIQEILKK